MSSPASASAFAQHLIRQFDLARRMLGALAQDFTEEEARQAPEEGKALLWYLGHVATSANYFLTLYTGEESLLSKEHHEEFGRGSTGHARFENATKASLVELNDRIADRVRGFLATLSPEDMERPCAGDAIHPMFKTLGSALSLVCVHDAYHAGQIANLRRSLGKDPLFG